MRNGATRVTTGLMMAMLCFALPCRSAATETRAIPLRIVGRGVKAAETPITVGVPFADGALADPARLRLTDGQGAPVPFQSNVLATWVKPGSGSIKWALLDFRARGLDKAEALHYTLYIGGPGETPVPGTRAGIVTQADDTMVIDTGRLRFSIPASGGSLIAGAAVDLNGNGMYEPDETVLPVGVTTGPYFVRADGVRFAAANDTNTQVTVEEQGPERVCVKIASDYVSEAGERLCRSFTRIHAYGNSTLLRLNHTLVFSTDMNRLQMRDIGIRFDAPCSSVTFGEPGGGGPETAVPGRLVQYEHDQYRIDTTGRSDRSAGRAPGWMTVVGNGVRMTIGLRDFWQKYPNELSADKDGLTIHFWPAHNEVAQEPEMTRYNLGHLWFAHHGKTLDLKTPETFHTFTIDGYSAKRHNNIRWSKNANGAGVARSFEACLAFGKASDRADAFVTGSVTTPPLCIVDPEYVCGTGAYGDIAACDREMFPETERALADRLAYELRSRQGLEDYGKWIYGNAHDSFGYNYGMKQFLMTYHRCWRNTHHGTLRAPWILYAHFGEPWIFDFAAANTEVNLDISFCHETVPGIPGSWGVTESKVKGGLCDYKGIVPWHSGNRSSYNSMVDFMLYYYYNTGNRWGLDVAMEVAELRRAQEIPGPHSYKYPGRGWVGPMNTDLNLYRLTGDEHFLKKAEGFLKKIHWSQLADGSFFNNWYSYAPALVNYYDFTGSDLAASVIVKWADFFLDFNIADEVGFTRGGDYSSETFNEAGGAHLDIMAAAYKITGDRKYLAWGKARMQLYALKILDDPELPTHGAGANDMAFYFLAQAPVLMKQLQTVNNQVAPLFPIWRYQAVPRIVVSKEWGEPVDFVIHYHNTNPEARLHFRRLEPTLGAECSRDKNKLPLIAVQGAPSFRTSIKVAIPGTWAGESEITFENVSEDFFLWVPIEVDGNARVVYTIPNIAEGFPLHRRGNLLMGVTAPKPEVEITGKSYIRIRGPFGFCRSDGSFLPRHLKEPVAVEASSMTLTVKDPLEIGRLLVFAGAEPEGITVRGFRGLTPFFAGRPEQFFMPKALQGESKNAE